MVFDLFFIAWQWKAVCVTFSAALLLLLLCREGIVTQATSVSPSRKEKHESPELKVEAR